MPFLFSHVQYCDMHYVYGYCDGNARAAVNEYRSRYPERRIPSKRVFTRVEQALRDNGCLASFALHSEREIVRTINTRGRTFLTWCREVHVCPLVEWPLEVNRFLKLYTKNSFETPPSDTITLQPTSM